MRCPKCGSDMEKVGYEGIEVDRCTGCRGIWFDMLEQEHLKALEGSESIDIGDPKAGQDNDIIGRIDCPACGAGMIRMVDNKHPHIRYEACTTCYGVYFDAGEFKDYKEETILGFFKDLFAKTRV